jgi:hypothetical protein
MHYSAEASQISIFPLLPRVPALKIDNFAQSFPTSLCEGEWHNAEILSSLNGSQVNFKCINTGNAKLLNKTIDAVVSLKPGCRVMLLFIVNAKLNVIVAFLLLKYASHGS